MNKKRFLETFEDMNRAKGVDQDTLLDALKESFRLTFAKKIEDEYKVDKKPVKVNSVNKEKAVNKLPDALVRVDIDVKKAKIDCFRQWLVVNDDDVQDDYIEIGLEEAHEKNPKLNVGEYYEEELSLDSLKDKDIARFKSCFTQKINKAEKDALLATFANKIGTIVTGTVEKCDAHSVIVELGRTTATLFQKDLIGDEKFNQGDSIKVYVEGIGKDDKKGSLVKISRSCNGYLKCLFENEIHEIYDGTVSIKYVERIPGRRAKVCVYSNDPNVDPSGACIGQNGNRIQNIVSQLGNAKDSKEKIDVVTWNPNLGLFISELLRPGKVLGMNIDEEKKEILVVTDEESLNLAIGFKGTNVVLARKITGYQIRVIDETKAGEEGIEYKKLDEYVVEAKEEERKRFREKQQEAIKSRVENLHEEENQEEIFVKEGDDEQEELETPVETVEPVMEEVETPKTEEKVEISEEIEEKPLVETKKVKEEEPVEFKEVKTTTTLESLERSLEEEKKEKSSSKKSFKKKKKEVKKDVEDDEEREDKKVIQKMDIYTDEELEAFENEDADEDFEDEEDYSEYDDDYYYEDR